MSSTLIRSTKQTIMSAKFKFNNGNLALLCSNCSKVIKTGKDFTKEELEASKGNKKLPNRFCTSCSDKIKQPNEVISKLNHHKI